MDIHVGIDIWWDIPIFGGIPISSSVFVTLLITIVLTIFSLIVYYKLLPKFKDVPSGFQSVLEMFVEWIYKFSEERLHGRGAGIAPYIGTLALYLGLANAIELIGLRPPTTNLSVTFAMAIISFILINYYAVSEKGIKGRIKDLCTPHWSMLPVNIMTKLAEPVSLAFRLYGNILGGLVVMELVYKSMKYFAVGIPAVLSIYFNIFDSLIQTYIFITLTLAFIQEAIE